MSSANLIKKQILEILNHHFIAPHNALKKKIVSDKITTERTFEKYLHELVSEKKVFRIPEDKIRIPIHLESGGTKGHIGTKGSPRVYYTTQKRLVGLKKKFLKFFVAEYKSLHKKYVDFVNMTADMPKKERIETINDFTKSLFALRQIMTAVYSIGSYWTDFSFEINRRFEKLDTLQYLFFFRIIDYHKDIYTKFFTQEQIRFLKQNQIRPFSSGQVDYS